MAATTEQLLAFTVYESRLLLSDHLGNDNDLPMNVRAAAHLAYAPHAQADAVGHGGSFDVQRAVAEVGSVDRLLPTDSQARLAAALASETPAHDGPSPVRAQWWRPTRTCHRMTGLMLERLLP